MLQVSISRLTPGSKAKNWINLEHFGNDGKGEGVYRKNSQDFSELITVT